MFIQCILCELQEYKQAYLRINGELNITEMIENTNYNTRHNLFNQLSSPPSSILVQHFAVIGSIYVLLYHVMELTWNG